ncbi:MAG: ABC transporter permease [Cyclonatronaceae bacterium]
MNTLKIIKYQLQDVIRSRWIIFYTLFFWLITDALFRFGGSGEHVILSLMNVVLIVIPLVSIVLGAMYLYNSREYIELLLSQPITRTSLFSGLYAGLTIPLASGFALGILAPFAYHGGLTSGGASGVFFLVFVGILLTVVFTALAFSIALRFEDKIKGLGLSLVLWLFFSVIYDGLILFIIYLFSYYPLQNPVIALTMLNPIDLGRILLMLNFDISALMGFTGAVFQRFFGSGFGMAVSLGVMLMWLAVPMSLAFRVFLRKDF